MPYAVEPVYKNNATVFYKDFNLSELPKNATINICGLGFYVLKINGITVSKDLLSPAFTAYDKKVFYNTYDIKNFLKSGDNLIEVAVGNGWFLETQKSPWRFERATWNSRHQLICEIYADNQLVLKSDSSWLCGRSKTTYNSLRYGETYDSTAEFNDHINASIGHGPGGILVPQSCPPIRLENNINPVSIISGNIYDFGKNYTGNVEITVRGERGTEVNIQYCERIKSDGSPNMGYLLPDPKLSRFQCDTYILSGEGEETWHSQFGYNGFRYAIITTDAEVLSVTARHFHTLVESIGAFECDNAFFNELQQSLTHSTLCNLHHLPTDCPHREKNGWTGDAHLSCEQALFNYDMKEIYIKWLDDIVDCQRPNGAIPCIAPTSTWGYNWGTGNAWDAVLFEIPYQLYLYYADKSVLQRYIPAMKKYIGFLEGMADGEIWKNGLGDWCRPEKFDTASTESILTGYAYRIYDLYSKTLKILGDADYSTAKQRTENIKQTFIATFEDKEKDSQTLLAMQLEFGLTTKPEEIFKRLLKQVEISDYHPRCGIFGTKWLFNVLSEYGRHDIACKILENDGYPGYKDMLKNCNGTLSENWECNSSLNHHMFSTIGAWFYKSVAGIRIDEENPGFKNIKISPCFSGSCSNFRAWHITPYGKLEIEKTDDKLKITLPEGCTADLNLRGQIQRITSSEIINI